MKAKITLFLTTCTFLVVFGGTSLMAKPCATTSPKTSITKAACAKGANGYEEAKTAWKAWVDQKKAEGKNVACKNCHEGTDFTKHKHDAETQYKNLGGQ